MAVLSIPVTDDIRKRMENLVSIGQASNLAEVGRKALQKYLDDLAVEAVFKAQKEPSLEGDLDLLAKQL